MNIRKILVVLICISVQMYSCKDAAVHESEGEVGEVEKESKSENENVIKLSREQTESIGIEYGYAEKKELANSIKASGILKVPNQNKAFVTPLFSGVVKTLNVEFGSDVKKGQPIATIYNPDLLPIQQQLQQLDIEIDLSEKEVARQQELVEGNATPLKNLQSARTRLATLKSQQGSLRNQLTGMGASLHPSPDIIIRAPISGTVSDVLAQIGSNVAPGTPIAEIVNNSQMHLDLFVYEKDLPRLKLNQTIHFTITNNATKEYDARIFSIGSAFENNSKTIRVHASIEGDKSGLINGMNVSALISLDTSNLLAVRSDAIVTENGKDYIFILAKEEQGTDIVFHRIPVIKGVSGIGYSAITPMTPIPDGAKVVTKGAFFIMGMLTNTEDHAH